MKVCLVNPRTDMMISDAVFPPLGLMYVSAAIRQAGHEAEIWDMAFHSHIPKAEIYGITGTSPQAGRMRRLVELIRIENPSAKIIGGGPHATLAPEEVLDYGCDVVVAGEAEEVIGKVLENGWEGIVRAPRIKNLDALPLPDRRQIDRYHFSINDLPATMMMTSRGCPHRCAFCSKPLGRRVVMRSVSSIIYEVRYIHAMHGIRAIMFTDDTMAIDRRRLLRFCAEMGKTGMTWRCLMRGEQVTKRVAKALARGGGYEVGIGVESGSDRILQNIQKGETIAEIEQGIRYLKEAGVRVKAFFIIGLPGEDRQSLAETEAFLERVPVDDVDFCILGVYRGSPIYQNGCDYDLEWEPDTYYKVDPSRYICRVRTAGLSSEELLEARARIEGRFKRWQT